MRVRLTPLIFPAHNLETIKDVDQRKWRAMQDPNFEASFKARFKVSAALDPASGSRLSPRDMARLQHVRSAVWVVFETSLTFCFSVPQDG